MKLSQEQIEKILVFDAKRRDTNKNGNKSRRSLTYNFIVPHTKTRDSGKRDVTIARVAVKMTKDMKPLVKVIEFTDLSTATSDGNVTINYRDMGFHVLAGWTIYWDSDEFEQRSISAWRCSHKFGKWEHEPYKFKCGLSAPFDLTVNPEDLAETKYRYCAFTDNQHRIGLIDWLMLYRKDSRVELLAKAGLFALINPAGLKALGDKNFVGYVKTHIDKMREYSKRCTAKEILWCVKHDATADEAYWHFAFVTEMRRFLPSVNNLYFEGKQTYRLDYERLRKAMSKWGIECHEYARYLGQAADAGLDLKCDGVLYPPIRDGRKSFIARLEELEAANAKRHRKEERDRKRAKREEERKKKEFVRMMMASRLEELAGFQSGVDRVMELDGNGYRCVVARSQKELRAEGRRMNNCVGNGIYGKGTVLGNTLILQFKDTNGRSWCDAEIDRSNWRVIQCYSRGNNTAPDNVWNLAKSIARDLKVQNRENRRNHTFPLLEKRCA